MLFVVFVSYAIIRYLLLKVSLLSCVRQNSNPRCQRIIQIFLGNILITTLSLEIVVLLILMTFLLKKLSTGILVLGCALSSLPIPHYLVI